MQIPLELLIVVFQGYEADNPNIELLRLRNYTLVRKLTDEEVVSSGITRIPQLVGVMAPFVRSFLMLGLWFNLLILL